MTVSAQPPSVLSAPIIPSAAGPGQVVGLTLQNPTSTALGGRTITFGQALAPGQVPAGASLVAMINGQPTPMQMDVKTTNPDGSVAMAVLTLAQPPLAAGASVPVMLTLAPATKTPAKPVDIGALAAPGSKYQVQVKLNLHNADGTTSAVTINAATALAGALKSGAYSTWLSGPQATQVRVDVPVAGSLHVTLDITAFADGNTSTTVTFNNDIAMAAHGGTATYDAIVTQNGALAFQQTNITQYQYTSWNTTVASNGAPAVNVQHDIAALQKTGLVQNYDLTAGVDASLVAAEATQMAKPGFGAVLGSAGVTQYMPMTGGRPDLGPTTEANTLWLLTQNATAAQYALAQANAAGSIPWHFYSPASGEYLTTTANPKLWIDYRGGMYGTTALTQGVPSSKLTGWTPDPAHQPDLDYVAYLMTGDRTYLDELNAEASYDVLAQNPTNRQGALGIVADGASQVRAQAWDLRAIVEAAAANPNGSAAKAYFTQLENNNFSYLLKYVSTLNEGQAEGWITGSYGNGADRAVAAGLLRHHRRPGGGAGRRRRGAAPGLGGELPGRPVRQHGQGVQPVSGSRLQHLDLHRRPDPGRRGAADLGRDRQHHAEFRLRRQHGGKRCRVGGIRHGGAGGAGRPDHRHPGRARHPGLRLGERLRDDGESRQRASLAGL